MTKIPRPSAEYEQEPFDPTLTFVENGVTTRHIDSALAESYISEPITRFIARGIPPEEREVRDHILLAHALRSKVTKREFWWSQFFRETQRYTASREAFARLEALCAKSPEHRAAFLRMANGDVMPPGLRFELSRIVTRRDKTKSEQPRRDGSAEF